MGPPYSPKDSDLIKTLIKSCMEAPEEWPLFPVVLITDAGTYKEGLSKLKTLETQRYTTDSDSRGLEKSKGIMEYYKSEAEIKKMLSAKRSESSTSSYSEDSCSLDEQIKKSKKYNNDIITSDGSSVNESDHKRKKKMKKPRKPTKVLQKLKKSPATLRTIRYSKNSMNKSSGDRNNNALVELSRSDSQTRHDSKLPDDISTPLDKIIKEKQSCKVIKKNSPLMKNNTENNATNTFSNNLFTDKEAFTTHKKNLKTMKDVDVVNKISLKDTSTDTAFLYIAIKKLTITVNTIAEEMQSLRNVLERMMIVKNNLVPISKFIEKYNFEKISSIEQFENFDLKLKENDEYAKDFNDSLEHLLGSTFKQTVINITKKFLHRDFAMSCTAIKKLKEKYVLKGSRFYDNFYDFISRYHKNPEGGGVITDKMFYQTLSSVLSGSKDWDGHRKFRQ